MQVEELDQEITHCKVNMFVCLITIRGRYINKSRSQLRQCDSIRIKDIQKCGALCLHCI